jgi:serine/threonine protein phosphatase 1
MAEVRRARGASFRSVEWGLFAVLVLTPIPLGSNRPLAWVLNGVLAVVLAAVAGVVAARRDAPDVDWRPVAWGLAAVSVLLAWMVVQTLPLPGLLLTLPAAPAPEGEGPVAVFATISADPSATWAAIVRFATPALLGLVALIVHLGRGGARRGARLLDVVILVAGLMGAYGLYALHFGSAQPSLVSTPDYAGFLTGTFVNRNTAATYLAVALVACIARFLETVGAPHGATGPRGRSSRGERSFGGIYVIAAAVLATALLSTGSRAGMVAGLAGLAVTLVVGARGLLRSHGRTWIVIVGAIAAVAVVAFLAAGSVVNRIGEEQVTDDTRFAVYSDTLEMIRDRPLVGHGAGTFATVFPLYHGPDVPSERVWLAAHNTYLQAAAELGLPALAVALALIAAALVSVLTNALSQRASAVAVAALGAVVVVGVHALLDFSIQIEAVAILFAILLGAGTGASFGARQAAQHGDPVPAERTTRGGLGYAMLEAVPATPREETAPRRAYVFGDLHGRSDLAANLKAAIARDLAERPCERPVIIGLGDYIDRGPDSRGVIEMLAAGLHPGADHVFLRGNHEQLLMDVLAGDEGSYQVWINSGGLDCLKSYGVDLREALRGSEGFAATRRALTQAMPYAHFAFLQATPLHHAEGPYLFVHGGVDPAKPLRRQTPRDFLWHRHEDKARDDVFERIVVHGHTPVAEPFMGRYRINLDTGAYASNRLSCLILEGRERRFLELPDAS